VAPKEVFTPAIAACERLNRAGQVPHLLIHPDLAEDFQGVPSGGPETAVVLGDAGGFFTYDRLNAAFRVLTGGADFYALAANRTFRDSDGELSMDAGAFVAALEYAARTKAEVLGKPAPAFFAAALEDAGVAAADAAMIGDDAESDIAGALAAGLATAILVRTGKYRTGDEERVQPRPTAVARDLSEAVDQLLE
jgi:HAD superfamily hydrolase (TIGR01458 family)